MVKAPEFWIKRSEVRAPAATLCAAVIVAAQTLEVYFHCLPSRLSDETLNRGPESSIALLVPAHYTKTLSLVFPKYVFVKSMVHILSYFVEGLFFDCSLSVCLSVCL